MISAKSSFFADDEPRRAFRRCTYSCISALAWASSSSVGLPDGLSVISDVWRNVVPGVPMEELLGILVVFGTDSLACSDFDGFIGDTLPDGASSGPLPSSLEL